LARACLPDRLDRDRLARALAVAVTVADTCLPDRWRWPASVGLVLNRRGGLKAGGDNSVLPTLEF